MPIPHRIGEKLDLISRSLRLRTFCLLPIDVLYGTHYFLILDTRRGFGINKERAVTPLIQDIFYGWSGIHQQPERAKKADFRQGSISWQILKDPVYFQWLGIIQLYHFPN